MWVSASTSERRTLRKVLKWLGGPLTLLLVGLLVAYIAFVPSAREPGYEFVTSFGGGGTAPGEALGELGRPMNIEAADGRLYVPEYFNDRLQVFDLDGTPIASVGETGSGPGQFNAPGGVAVAADGDLYVADFYNQRVQQLSPDGEFIRQWGTSGEASSAAGEFSYPTDVALGPDGTLFVADGYNDRIQAFAEEGDFLRKWGGPFAMNIHGPFNGWFTTVTSIAVDAEGNVYAADFYNHRVQKFSADGRLLTSFGEHGDAAGQFDYPIGVAIAADGNVFVADYGNQRIQRWRPRE